MISGPDGYGGERMVKMNENSGFLGSVIIFDTATGGITKRTRAAAIRNPQTKRMNNATRRR